MSEMNNDSATGSFLNMDEKEIVNITEEQDIETLATSYLTYRIGQEIGDRRYLPVLVPIGVSGNVLSFLVMLQAHNRQMSISLYIAMLALSDTTVLLSGLVEHIHHVYEVDFGLSPRLFSSTVTMIQWTAVLCSTLFILNMTFGRFYSIIRPHKAASFNTVKRAKITVCCIVVFSIVFNIPHSFTTAVDGEKDIPFGNGIETVQGQMYYWTSFIMNFALPFVLLLIMNSVIIHTLRRRSGMQIRGVNVQGQGQNEGQGQTLKLKRSEVQIFATLLLVTFSFLILTTPAYILVLYVFLVNYDEDPKTFAGFHLFNVMGHSTLFTNCAINFFLYVISGQKFRTDLKRLFKRKRSNLADSSQTTSTRISCLETNNHTNQTHT